MDLSRHGPVRPQAGHRSTRRDAPPPPSRNTRWRRSAPVRGVWFLAPSVPSDVRSSRPPPSARPPPPRVPPPSRFLPATSSPSGSVKNFGRVVVGQPATTIACVRASVCLFFVATRRPEAYRQLTLSLHLFFFGGEPSRDATQPRSFGPGRLSFSVYFLPRPVAPAPFSSCQPAQRRGAELPRGGLTWQEAC